MSWSELVSEALGGPGDGPGAAVERFSVRPGEVLARVRGHEVSLIRTVWADEEWGRACAALASQPLFRARLLSGELPDAAARVFGLLGLDLVPRGWGALVATCSCDHWRGRCAHLSVTAAALGAESDRDPFVLTRWAGRERRTLVELVRDLPAGTKGPSAREAALAEERPTRLSEEHPGAGDGVFAAQAQTADPLSPAAFWSAPAPPPPPLLPADTADRVRAAAAGHVADHLPGFDRSEKPFSTLQEDS
ncbi:hypothetical protein NE857_15790 [Nocardiopsis exhalans]|uniref:SWIM-type domain-containing protein n=1 Tax=Nocardiopsis exhalans TaxID=163604 RepID=A0ABY5DI78_9ACTN|nr:hypothetical protein [Nocardiopsis exhalans]USY22943.1 hypothetical protein NE857_15790 [Nocardiopsis exhalans]